MFLKRIEMHQFGPYVHAVVDFPQTGLVLLIGANNAGKSAFLRALDVLASGDAMPVSRYVSSAVPAELTATFALDEADRYQVFQASPSAEAWLESRALKELTFDYVELNDGKLYIREIRSTDHLDEPLVLGKVVRALTEPATGEASTVDLGVWLAHAPADRLSDPPSAPELVLKASGALGNYLANLHGGPLQLLTPAIDAWRASYFHFLPHRPGTSRSKALQSDSLLTPDGANLPEVLLYVSTNREHLTAWLSIRSVMADIVPDLGEVEVPTAAKQVAVKFFDPHLQTSHNIQDLGSGVAQLLLLSCVGEYQTTSRTVIVEEPEQYLHPEAQRRLLQYLNRWSQDRVIIAATHSTVFLDKSGVDGAHVWFVERSKGVSALSPANARLPDVLTTMGVRLSDVLSAERVLIVEGDTDLLVLRAWMGPLLDEMGVTVVAGRAGGDAAWQIDAFERWLGVTDVLTRKIRFLRDHDELPESVLDKLSKTGKVRVLARREIENYLMDPATVRSVLLARREQSQLEGAVGRIDDIADELKAAADSLKEIVVLKRVAQSILPLRLIDRNAIHRLESSTTRKRDLLQHVTAQLPPTEYIVGLEREWDRTAGEVGAGWNKRWKEWAPGANVLSLVWQRHGLSFSKARDVPLLALGSKQPPRREFREHLKALFDDG